MASLLIVLLLSLVAVGQSGRRIHARTPYDMDGDGSVDESFRDKVRHFDEKCQSSGVNVSKVLDENGDGVLDDDELKKKFIGGDKCSVSGCDKCQSANRDCRDYMSHWFEYGLGFEDPILLEKVRTSPLISQFAITHPGYALPLMLIYPNISLDFFEDQKDQLLRHQAEKQVCKNFFGTPAPPDQGRVKVVLHKGTHHSDPCKAALKWSIADWADDKMAVQLERVEHGRGLTASAWETPLRIQGVVEIFKHVRAGETLPWFFEDRKMELLEAETYYVYNIYSWSERGRFKNASASFLETHRWCASACGRCTSWRAWLLAQHPAAYTGAGGCATLVALLLLWALYRWKRRRFLHMLYVLDAQLPSLQLAARFATTRDCLRVTKKHASSQRGNMCDVVAYDASRGRFLVRMLSGHDEGEVKSYAPDELEEDTLTLNRDAHLVAGMCEQVRRGAVVDAPVNLGAFKQWNPWIGALEFLPPADYLESGGGGIESRTALRALSILHDDLQRAAASRRPPPQPQPQAAQPQLWTREQRAQHRQLQLFVKASLVTFGDAVARDGEFRAWLRSFAEGARRADFSTYPPILNGLKKHEHEYSAMISACARLQRHCGGRAGLGDKRALLEAVQSEQAEEGGEGDEPGDGLVRLLERGALAQERLNVLLKGIAKESRGKANVAKLKSVVRILEKCYTKLDPTDPHAEWPLAKCSDVVRGMLVYDDLRHQQRGLKELERRAEAGAVALLEVEDRYSAPAGGWCDITVILAFPDGEGAALPMELQIVHEHMYLAREKLGGHHTYNKTRTAQALLRQAGRKEAAEAVGAGRGGAAVTVTPPPASSTKHAKGAARSRSKTPTGRRGRKRR